MLARTGESEGATEGCSSLLPWHWPCALVVEQLTAALELFGRQLRQNLREVAADGGSERGSNWRVRFPGQPLQNVQSVYGQTRLIPTVWANDRYWHKCEVLTGSGNVCCLG